MVGTLVGFGALSVLFVLKEVCMQERAMFPCRLFRNNLNMVVSCAFVFFFPGCFFAILYYLPIYFQAMYGASAAQSGIRTLPLVLGVGILSMMVGFPLQLTEQLPQVLKVYMEGLKVQFVLDTVLVGAATVISLGLGLRKLAINDSVAMAG